MANDTKTDPANITQSGGTTAAAPARVPVNEDYERLTSEEKRRFDAAQQQKTQAQEAVEQGLSAKPSSK